MIHQLKLTILLLLVASISFAQQNVVNTSKSNVKDFVVADSAKVVPLPTVVKQTKYTTKTKAATNVMIETPKSHKQKQQAVQLEEALLKVVKTQVLLWFLTYLPKPMVVLKLN